MEVKMMIIAVPYMLRFHPLLLVELRQAVDCPPDEVLMEAIAYCLRKSLITYNSKTNRFARPK